MNKYRQQLVETLLQLKYLSISSPAITPLISNLEGLVYDENLLLVDKSCLPLKFEKKRELTRNPMIEPMIEYSLNLRLKTAKKIPVTLDSANSCAQDCNDDTMFRLLKEDFYYYLENVNENHKALVDGLKEDDTSFEIKRGIYGE